MKMNQQTKINFILEHIAHIDDLIKDNIDEALLSASLRDIKFLLEKQLQTIHERKGIAREPRRCYNIIILVRRVFYTKDFVWNILWFT